MIASAWVTFSIEAKCMGIYDRDYYRETPRGFAVGSLAGFSVTTWIIVVNVAVFVLDAVLKNMGYVFVLQDRMGRPVFVGPPLEFFGLFSVTTVVGNWEVWRFITYQFLHANLMHLGFNMLALYFFGGIIEDYLGSRRYLAYYLIAGVAGAILYLALYFLNVLVYYPWTPLIGASAGIYGILIGAATLAPNSQVMIMLFPFFVPMRLRTLAMVMIGIAVYQVFLGGNNAGGEAAHLGGAALGYLLIRNSHLLSFVDGFSLGGLFAGRRSSEKARQSGNGAWECRMRAQEDLEEEVDRILRKIKLEGMDSLTSTERDTLIHASRQRE